MKWVDSNHTIWLILLVASWPDSNFNLLQDSDPITSEKKMAKTVAYHKYVNKSIKYRTWQLLSLSYHICTCYSSTTLFYSRPYYKIGLYRDGSSKYGMTSWVIATFCIWLLVHQPNFVNPELVQVQYPDCINSEDGQ